MARDNTGFVCHAHDAMVSYERHHVWPLGYHGPNVPSNLIKICPNAHSDIHFFMEYLLRHNGSWPEDWRTYGPTIRRYAMSGYEQVMAYGESLAQQLAR